MNLFFAKRAIDRYFQRVHNLRFTYQREKERVNGYGTIALSVCDDHVLGMVDVYRSGVLDISFVFDHLRPSPRALQLLNEYNNHSPWLKAYIREDGYLCLRYCVCHVSYGDLVSSLRGVCNSVLTEELVQFLRQLTSLTTEEEAKE